jgi:hypothetical protein
VLADAADDGLAPLLALRECQQMLAQRLGLDAAALTLQLPDFVLLTAPVTELLR